MSGQSFPRVPVNPRLEFGVPLEEVCENGVLHPGLRELFLKAYLSAGGDDRDGAKQYSRSPKNPYVLEALKAGPKGQGSLADRISLKLKLESGKWIIATQTPIGAPLWLLRHFLGCLPRPLLDGSHWRGIAVACGDVSCPQNYHHDGEFLENIEIALRALPKENYSILVALILLIRNLSSVTPTRDSDSLTLHEEAVEALSQYFIAAIISRPYRPGLYTRLDKEHKPLLVFLSGHWLEVEELCRHTGISRYHTTCESRYEFVSPDTDVDHTMWQVMATAEDIDDKIDVPESFARKSNHPLPQITNPNVQKTEIQGDRVPVTVHTPKGVYFIPSNVECIRMSVADEEDGVIEDSNDAVEFDDRSGQLDVPKVDHLGCLLPARRVAKDKSNTDLRFEVKKPIKKYEPEMTPFTGIQHQAFRCDGMPGEIGVTGVVKAKINGTQTFECEFPEDGQLMEVKKLREIINEARVSPVNLILNDNDTQQMLEENVLSFVIIGSSSVLKFCKMGDKRIDKPLTRSTALLIKNFSSGEEIVYFPARRVDLQNEKVIDEVDQVSGVKEAAVTSKTDKDGKTLTNPFKNLNKLKDQKRNSNYIDFVTELKDNFKQGRRKPSDAKSSSQMVLTENDSEPEVPTTMRKGSSKVLRTVEFLSEEATDFSGLAESSSTQEIFLKTSCAPISSANSI